MKKNVRVVLLCFLCAIALFPAIYKWINHVPYPKTNLEYWIADSVDRMDFATHQEKFGLMGGREFYGKGYMPTEGENGEQTDPEHCVIYTVTSYPDYISNKRCVTQIYIHADPYGAVGNSDRGFTLTVNYPRRLVGSETVFSQRRVNLSQ